MHARRVNRACGHKSSPPPSLPPSAYSALLCPPVLRDLEPRRYHVRDRTHTREEKAG